MGVECSLAAPSVGTSSAEADATSTTAAASPKADSKALAAGKEDVGESAWEETESARSKGGGTERTKGVEDSCGLSKAAAAETAAAVVLGVAEEVLYGGLASMNKVK